MGCDWRGPQPEHTMNITLRIDNLAGELAPQAQADKCGDDLGGE